MVDRVDALRDALRGDLLRERIEATEAALASGVQQTRFPDGSGVTMDLAALQRSLDADRAELSALRGAPVRARISFHRVLMRR